MRPIYFLARIQTTTYRYTNTLYRSVDWLLGSIGSEVDVDVVDLMRMNLAILLDVHPCFYLNFQSSPKSQQTDFFVILTGTKNFNKTLRINLKSNEYFTVFNRLVQRLQSALDCLLHCYPREIRLQQ